MPMVIVGVLLLAAKMADIGPTAGWSWWVVLAPFAMAVAWWAFADSTGLTQRRAMQKMEDRKTARRDKAMVSLGLDHKRQGRVEKARGEARKRADTMAGNSGGGAKPGDPPRRDPRA